MVARVEPIKVIMYTVFCQEDHGTGTGTDSQLGTFDTSWKAIAARDAHNRECELSSITETK